MCYALGMVILGIILASTGAGLAVWGYRVGWRHGSNMQFDLDLVAFKRELLKKVSSPAE